jgi:hypothetical protein
VGPVSAETAGGGGASKVLCVIGKVTKKDRHKERRRRRKKRGSDYVDKFAYMADDAIFVMYYVKELTNIKQGLTFFFCHFVIFFFRFLADK